MNGGNMAVNLKLKIVESSESWRKELKNPYIDMGDMEGEAENDCVLCGKPSNKVHHRYSLHIVDGGGRIGGRGDEELIEMNDSGDMYWFSLGSSCAKKLEKAIKDLGLNPSSYIY